MLLQNQKLTCVANTGPLISAFQCGRVDLLELYFSVVHVPSGCLPEFVKHGIAGGIQQLIDESLVIVHVLTDVESEEAKRTAEEIALSPLSKDSSPESHIPDAEAIVLMKRQDIDAAVILLDELAAREVAMRRGYAVTGFPGILYYAVRHTRLTPEEARSLLYVCQRAGTYYSSQFIEGLYQKMREVTA